MYVCVSYCVARVGQNHIYIRCIYDIFGREITKFMNIWSYPVYTSGSGQP
jgi:hypothetical protein